MNNARLKDKKAVVVGGAAGFAPILKVTVLEIRSGSVRLGFEIDSSVPVHRLEVWERIRAGGELSAPPEAPAAPAGG